LPRPWQILAAGGAISCGERANVLRRQPKDSNVWAFGVALQAENVCLSRCKDTKKMAEMQEKWAFLLLFAHLFVPLALPKVLSLENERKNDFFFVFCSLIRTFAA
jgi:hypothetical protein